MGFDQVINWIWAAAALGTAAFGFVEALKWTPLGIAGIGRVNDVLGAPGKAALSAVYGDRNVHHVLNGTFRKSAADLSALLKNGLRVALTQPEHARALGQYFGQSGEALEQAVVQLRGAASTPALAGADPTPPAPPTIDARAVLGKFELAVDARIDAAIAAASDTYAGTMRIVASIVAVLASVFVAYSLGGEKGGYSYLQAVAVGIAAVPIAPIAKDLVTLLNCASDALRGRVSAK